jgi:serine/threonine-protein kinase
LAVESLVDGLCDQFEAAWKRGTPPRIDDYLDGLGKQMPGPVRRRLLEELATLDVYYRWSTAEQLRGGDRGTSPTIDETQTGVSSVLPPLPTLDDYCRLYPVLGLLEELPLPRILQEYCVRRDAGATIDENEFSRRFGKRAAEVREALKTAGAGRTQALRTTGPAAGSLKRSGKPVTVEQFIERLTRSGLMSAAEVSTFQDSLPPGKRPNDVQQLAQALVRQGKLTKYQAQAVYQGKTEGLVFGEYVVLDKLGEGGMGVVLKARHRRMKRTVAIKVLSSAGVKQAGSVERFHREVEAAAKLSHPNVVTAHDAGQHHAMHYLVMEFVEGSDLARLVKDRGPLGVREAVEYVLQAARGLQYAHEQGIVHRDIKPGNLLVDARGTVKVLDMGLARMTAVEAALGGPERLTTTGQVMGTCDYMSPEQALDSHVADHRTDIYALGCTLYRLVTGNPPYRGETLMQILLAHRDAPIPSLCEARPEAPAELDKCFRRMVAKQPGDRQQSMAEVVAELEAVLAVLAGRHDRPSNLVGQARAAIARFVRKPLVLAGLAGGLVLLLAVVLTLTLRHGTLVVEIDEQLGKDVHVAVSQGGQKVQLADARSGWTLSLSAGKYDLAVQGGDDQFQLDSHTITVTRGGQVKVKVTLKPPPLAVAPFDAQKARDHQQCWARYLGLPVEITNSLGMKLVLIPPGEFMMGSSKELIEEESRVHGSDRWYMERLPDEGPQHRVRITKPFYLGVTEVTQEEYQQVAGVNPSEFSATGRFKDKVAGQDTRRFPVDNVAWDQALEFCRKLSEMPGEMLAGRTYRLPSEAQWEYACRAGSAGRYSFSSGSSGIPQEYEERELSEYGWSKDNSRETTHAVGLKRANGWGLYDMQGNVRQWCQDWFDKDYYAKSATDEPAGPFGGSSHVIRGGAWDQPAALCRPAYRVNGEGLWGNCLGLRVFMALTDK